MMGLITYGLSVVSSTVKANHLALDFLLGKNSTLSSNPSMIGEVRGGVSSDGL